jgi:hypothetical protein
MSFATVPGGSSGAACRVAQQVEQVALAGAAIAGRARGARHGEVDAVEEAGPVHAEAVVSC